jgi:hypothetical protein
MVSTGRSERTSPGEFIERLKYLIANNITESERLLTRFRGLVREANQAVGTGGAGERPNAETLLSRWLDFNLASYSVVSTHSLALLNGLLSAAQSTLISKAAPAPDARATATPRVELRLSGRHGERATTGFVIENQFDRPLEVRFESTALIPATTGPELPAPLVSFEPTTLVIAPRGQGVVQVAVMITADFVAGQTYRTTIRPLGFEAKELGLSLIVLPPTKDAVPLGPSPERGGPS